MKNSSLSLLIMLPILLVSIGMYTYTSSQSTIIDSNTSMSTAEIEAFNSQFTMYAGKQKGTALKSLMGTLIANANTYREEPNKLPEVSAEIVKSNSSEDEDLNSEVTVVNAKTPEKNEVDSLQEYIDALSEIRNSVGNKDEYNVSFEYTNNGVLNQIVIER